MDWFLYGRSPHHERVNVVFLNLISFLKIEMENEAIAERAYNFTSRYDESKFLPTDKI